MKIKGFVSTQVLLRFLQKTNVGPAPNPVPSGLRLLGTSFGWKRKKG